MNSATVIKSNAIKKACKVVEIDETVTKIIFKDVVSSIKIEDQATAKTYRIQRTPVKRGLQMTGG
jgi:hypothetical protein